MLKTKSLARLYLFAASLLVGVTIANSALAAAPEAVVVPVGATAIHGDLSKPSGNGPFPAVLWNHGGVNPRPGVTDYSVSSELGQLFTSHGYVFLLPHRRGYGRSPSYELAQQFTSEKREEERNRVQLELMRAYEKDVAGGVEYLRKLVFVDPQRIAVAGCSFGGSLALFAAEQNLPIRSVVNFAGAAVSWKQSADLRERMLAAARDARVPVLLVQAENDYDLNPTHALAWISTPGDLPNS